MNKWMIWGYHYFWKHPYRAYWNNPFTKYRLYTSLTYLHWPEEYIGMNQSPPQQTNRALPPPNWRHWYAINKNSRFLCLSHPQNTDVSKNRGTPKSSILIGFSIIFTIHFGGKITLFLETSICRPKYGAATNQRINGMDLLTSRCCFPTWKL